MRLRLWDRTMHMIQDSAESSIAREYLERVKACLQDTRGLWVRDNVGEMAQIRNRISSFHQIYMREQTGRGWDNQRPLGLSTLISRRGILYPSDGNES
jgi:hypothetical protein